MTKQRAAQKLGALILVGSLCAGVAGCTIGTVDPAPSSPAAPASASRAPVRDDAVRYAYPAPNADPAQNYGKLYLPPGRHDARSLPVVMLIHGGGWKARATERYMADVARQLQSAGLAVWNIEYRRVGSGGGWPTTFTDVGNAADFIPALAQRVPALDPTNVIFVGHSAGGQLAAWAATRRTLPPGAPGVTWPPGGAPALVPRAFVSMAGVLDMRTSSRMNDHVRMALGGMPDQVPERYALANPIQRIDPGMPAVAIHGTRDGIVPAQESTDFVQKAQAAGEKALLVSLDGATHGTPVNVKSQWWPTIEDTIVRLATRGFDDLAANAPQPPR
ncbi:Dipeptidylaminopeptidase/acylaminoacyl-peptidase-like protein OS=Tsukamurella paurometabola (strain ATCC 8368 / DSM / CCUG 35730 / CIP 100753 / JCM 10117/ KCTC 9821 / NBRC 16120 / NCIMB 702349 / NCTC 13040) OX=521096 GN=Tpau_3437 PE=4 SV=1 [Tsukamurella paurometabola]|uniref:Dipeptidylaminopeptidase/acylaminoacyl-peptidase-like protein n=1 Tax=Tsukamurella paurometabola (strain ATCC 8368 / DSM 20162 / CCUG 35730 / CIP 100753 / JCM 10117 / KCTC 9821 / NBRC 16120 / NCIMB 702349 / NCTC 13040) TaxID=521096 RepID=D5UX02_TSUPD|nr:alpha/beta fold hydrolase [Tsukamurella paurometabola]ADG80021.1 Dipeptidylaminopeptidase/acylaminoacyl-peptidase -like protein [Tsukamurella paurometabola DSM 20162]SUP38080.1 Predicted dienelactone hydrolase [Tsukamurella paurometabola]